MNFKKSLLMLCSVLAITTNCYCEEMYSWEDEEGIHFTDNPINIPAKHRKRTNKRNMTKQEHKNEPSVKDKTPAVTNSNSLVSSNISVSTPQKSTPSNVLSALKKLWARYEAGISYRDFAPALGDTKFEVNNYNENPENKSNDKFNSAINSAMAHYEFAMFVWGQKFRGRSVIHNIDRYSYPGTKIMEYPNANNRQANGGVLVDGKRTNPTAIDIELAVRTILREAKAEIDQAEKILISY